MHKIVPVYRRLFVTVLAVALSLSLVLAVLGLVAPAPGPALRHLETEHPRLSKHLLLVVVDGLRYDIATSPQTMPKFSQAMHQHTSGEIWAGRVSMTTSAVMTYGTGQRGRLEQVVRNVHPEPPPFDSWLKNGHAAGLRLVAVGDPAWPEMYGAYLAESYRDPAGVSIDVDFNPQTFRDTRRALSTKPDFLVAHFVTPDHQGHAYGIFSKRYLAHIHDFDRQLHDLLGSLGPEWTVFVTSDHGAADSGTHGTDVPVQRRSPIYAYGPGIADGVHSQSRLDQADLPGTFAALLGLPLPLHSRGHLLTSWLDVPPEQRARLACANAERAQRYARAVLGEAGAFQAAPPCVGLTDNERAMESARVSVARVDAAIGEASGLASPRIRGALLAVSMLALLLSWGVLGPALSRALPGALFMIVVAVGLTYGTERLPGSAPMALRAVLFVGANLAILALLLRPAHTIQWLDRRRFIAVALFPGALVVTYTTNAQPEAYVAVVVLCVLGLLGRLGPRPATPIWKSLRLELGWLHSLIVAVALIFLYRAGVLKSEIVPRELFRDAALLQAVAMASVAVAGGVVAYKRARGNERWLLGTLALVLSAFVVMRGWVPAWLGRSAIVVLGLAATGALLKGRPTWALFLGVGSYLWVSRDFELPALLATLIVADGMGKAVAAGLASDTDKPSIGQSALLAVACFGLLFVQRVALGNSLDFGGVDWGVAGFGDQHVPAWLVGTALTYKYALAGLLVIGCLLRHLPRPLREAVTRGLLLIYVVRCVVLLGMLYFCGSSFWTALRVTGDLPYGIVGLLASALAWLFLATSPKSAEPEPSAGKQGEHPNSAAELEPTSSKQRGELPSTEVVARGGSGIIF